MQKKQYHCWAEAEELELRELFQELGNDWAEIALRHSTGLSNRQYQTKTQNMRLHTMKKRPKRATSSGVDKRDLGRRYTLQHEKAEKTISLLDGSQRVGAKGVVPRARPQLDRNHSSGLPIVNARQKHCIWDYIQSRKLDKLGHPRYPGYPGNPLLLVGTIIQFLLRLT
jgi:hypothetical protein